MRSDSVALRTANEAAQQEPRFVVELAFDSDNTVLHYFTSHSDAALPGAVSVTHGVLEGLSGSSQRLNTAEARAEIGTINVRLLDKDGTLTNTLGTQLAVGRSTRQQRMRVYLGAKDLVWADYSLIQTQLVDEIRWENGVYTLKCADVQRAMRKDIFDLATTTLAATLSETDTTVTVYDTSAFTLVAHGTSYSDAPSQTVGYIKIKDEVIRYTGKTATTFTGCTRGALNTKAAEHKVDESAAPERRPKVEEYVYLEMPAVKLAHAILTGALYGQGGATLPASWHLGIAGAYVRQADFTGIGPDLWNTADDNAGFPVRFEALTKTDGKQFIEKELMLLAGLFMPVYTDGALGLKRMANVLAGAAYVAQLDTSNVVEASELTHAFDDLRNRIQIEWNYEPAQKGFTRTTLLIDSDSITVHQKAPVYKIAFRGLHGSRHTAQILSQRFDAIRDRYTGPPLEIEATTFNRFNRLEVGDVVRLKLDTVRDFVANTTLDRSFEVQNIAVDWITGAVKLSLFASSRAPVPLSSTTGNVLSDGWYTGAGTNLTSVLTISGDAVTASGTINGGADMNGAASIFYYAGNLTINAGVTVTITGNVQLRVRGFLQINGTIDGAAGGKTGATAPAAACDSPPNGCTAYVDDVTAGTAGFLGPAISGGSMLADSYWTADGVVVATNDGYLTAGQYNAVPVLALKWDGTNLTGIPSDLRGTSGGSGRVSNGGGIASLGAAQTATAGNGGNSGAGLVTVSRGAAFGGSGKVILSGANGATGTTFDAYTASGSKVGVLIYSGSGAGGCPGAGYFVIDGGLQATPSISTATCVALSGLTPIPADATSIEIQEYGTFLGTAGKYYTDRTGPAGTAANPVPDLSGPRGAFRAQFVPANETAAPDPTTLPIVNGLNLASGTSELLIQLDGTVVPRIKAGWTAVSDARVVGYELRFKPSSDSLWAYAPPAIGISTTTAWLSPVRSGINYDVAIRALGAARQVGEWATITAYPVIGKTELPADVTGLAFDGLAASWNAVTDVDRRGYRVRYQIGASTNWATATSAHASDVVTATRLDVTHIYAGTGGFITILVKAVDTSGNESQTAASLYVDVRPSNVAWINVAQSGELATADWPDLPDGDITLYELRYGPPGALFGNMRPLTRAEAGTSFTTTKLPPGSWRVGIVGQDRGRNQSATPAYDDIVIAQTRDVIVQTQHAPDWAGMGNRLMLSGCYAQVPDNDLLDMGTSSFAVEIWLRSTTTANPVWLAYKNDGAAGAGWRIYINAGQLEAFLSDGVTYVNSQFSTSNWADGKKHHFVYVFDRAANQMRVYVDGTLHGNAVSTAAVTGSCSNGVALRIGGYTDTQYFFTGEMNDFALHPYLPTTQQIADWYAGMHAVTGLRLWLPLQESGGATVVDYSGNGLNGTLTGTYSRAPDALRYHFVRHSVSGALIPDSTRLASEHTNAELFETFVKYPFATSIYEPPEVDIDFDDDPRLWAEATAELGAGQSGDLDYHVELDYRTAAGQYDGFENWEVGQRDGRYFKFRAVMNNTAGSVGRLSGFKTVVDQVEWPQSGTNTMASGGRTVTFPLPYHDVPTSISVGPAGSAAAARLYSWDQVTATGMRVFVYTTAGAEAVGDTFAWNVEGV